MWQLFKDLLRARKDIVDTRKALRVLQKQEWSYEFLVSLLVRAARMAKTQLEMTIVSPNGAKLIVRSADNPENKYTDAMDSNIFDHLDDDRAIKEFVERIR